jgi:hypothetical protein
MGAGCFVPRRHRSPRGRAWEALWCPGPAHGGVGALSQRHLARGGVCATRFACPGRFGRRARSSRPCRATGQLPSATLRVCARPVQTPAVAVLSMQTWATPRAHVLVGASHRRRVPLRQRPACSSRNVFRRPRKSRATRAPPTSWPDPGCSAPRGGCRGNVQPGRGRNAAAERRREGKIWRLTPERPAWSDETGAYAACVPPQDVRVPPIACAWRLGGHVGRSPPLTQPRKCCHPFPRRILLCPVPAHAPHRQVHTHHPPTHAHTRPTASPAAPPASSITAAVRQAPRCMPATPTRARRARPHAPTGCCSPRPPRREGGSAVRYHSGIWRIQNSRRQACRISRPRHLHFNRGEHGDAAVGAYGRTWPSAVGRGCPHVTPPKRRLTRAPPCTLAFNLIYAGLSLSKRRPRTPTAGHDHRSNVRAPAGSIGPAPKPELA